VSSIDQQFIEFIVRSIVSKPDEVKVDRRIDEKGVLLELTVDPEDLGRVIGKRGATAQSLRTLLRALGTKNDARYNLKIIDNGTPYERPQRDDYQSHDQPREQFHDDHQADQPAQPVTEQPVTEQPAADTAEPAESIEPAENNETAPLPPAEPEVKQEETDRDMDAEAEADQADHESVVSKTRKELEDLDDLDV
jgi:hypothetical protein